MNTNDKYKDQITGLILAGGQGTRMGKVDKGLQNFRGAPMALHVMMKLSAQVGQILINANQNIPVYEGFGVPVWPDQTEGYAGPLAGLQTGLIHCETPWLLSAPCDSPFLPVNLATSLMDAALAQNANIAVAATWSAEDQRVMRQPVFALVHAGLLESLNRFLNSDNRKVDAWFRQHTVAEVIFDDVSAFRNINTLQELRDFEHE